jgi:hypothetical protein
MLNLASSAQRPMDSPERAKTGSCAHRGSALRLLTLGALVLWNLLPLQAHVKWFTEGTYSDKPLSLTEIMNPLFWQLGLLTVAVVALGVWMDDRLKRWTAYQQVNTWLSARSDKGTVVMRIALAMTLLLSWQADSMLVPNLGIKTEWIGWYQFGLAFLLLFPRTVPLAGLGTVMLYGVSMANFSSFHMLDYLMYVGVGWYLLVSASPSMRWRKSGLLVLYLSIGFSLCWVALEKFVYPEWAYQIMDKHNLTMGIDNALFLSGAAFVEFGLGYLILICLLERPLAVIITLVFFTTTMVFGKVEIIGHTLLHGCLIVFLLEGPSVVEARLRRHLRSVGARMVFAVIGFALLFPALILPYTVLANRKYDNRNLKDAYGSHHEHIPLEVPKDMLPPSVDLVVEPDPMSGYNLHIKTEHFRFAPEHAGQANMPGEGHAHLYVNGTKIARLYSNWYHLPQPPEGKYDIEVSLHANQHQMLTLAGEPIRDAELIEVGKVFKSEGVPGAMPGMDHEGMDGMEDMPMH